MSRSLGGDRKTAVTRAPVCHHGSQLSAMSLLYEGINDLDHFRNALLNGDCGLLIPKSLSTKAFEVCLDPAMTCE